MIELVKKTCSICLQKKPLALFPIDKKRDKHHTYCLVCANEKTKKSFLKNQGKRGLSYKERNGMFNR